MTVELFTIPAFMDQLDDLLSAVGIPEEDMAWTTRIVILAIVLMLTAAVDYFCRNVLTKVIQRIISKTETKWDDYLLNADVLNNLWHLILPVIVYFFIPAIFHGLPSWEYYTEKILQLYIVAMSVRFVCAILGGVYTGTLTHKGMENHPLKGLYQMLKLMVIAIGVIVGISTMLDKNPLTILTGLGAAATVLMLVFKDTILGLVAGIQLTANDMLQVGDWITIPSHNANGIVREVTLTTVKIQNYDNTIITVPPYSLVSESFQNWRGMQDSGARRVMRAINIDINTIRFVTKDELNRLVEHGWIEKDDVDPKSPTVNLRIFRKYLERYIAGHPDVRSKDTLTMIRQLDPTTNGLPVQLYFFTADTEWKSYEATASDIFDHVIAVVNEFGLRIFQSPTGNDVTAIFNSKCTPLHE